MGLAMFMAPPPACENTVNAASRESAMVRAPAYRLRSAARSSTIDPSSSTESYMAAHHATIDCVIISMWEIASARRSCNSAFLATGGPPNAGYLVVDWVRYSSTRPVAAPRAGGGDGPGKDVHPRESVERRIVELPSGPFPVRVSEVLDGVGAVLGNVELV